ncbi:MAG: hypothetical protein WA814_11790 [Candidatus Baltobacteraceae bacterium]
MLRLALLFAIALVVYDVVAASIARALTISFDSFVVLALVLLFFMGLLAGRKARSWDGIVPVALAAAVEATVGWYLAALIGPGYVPDWTVRTLLVMGVERALLSTVIGAAGVWVGIAVARSRRLF